MASRKQTQMGAAGEKCVDSLVEVEVRWHEEQSRFGIQGI